MKKILLLCLLIILAVSAKSQSLKVKGVITYYFNEYQGDKPDIGANIYIHQIDSTKKDSSFLNDYSSAKSMLHILELTKKNKNYPNRDVYISWLKIHNYNTKASFDSLDRKTYLNLLKIENDSKTLKTTVDGTGNYSIDLKPGWYEEIIISKGRTDITEMEVGGKIYFISFLIKDIPYISDHSFGL